MLPWFAFLLALAASAQELPQKERIVVVVSLDGFPAFALEDARLPAPTLRRLAREGAWAKRMKSSNPTVTWPAHTTMVTGVPPAKHSVLYNGLLVRQGPKSPVKVEPYHDKTELVRATTVYDLAHQAGLTTAQVDWVAIEHAPTITWQFHEWPDPAGAIEREMIGAGLVGEADVREFTKANITWRDRVWTGAAAHILTRHRPNLLLFHVLNLDSTHHQYGPKTLASYTGMAYADDVVRRIVDEIESAGLKERTTLLVVSDHGFKSAKRWIKPNAVLRQTGLFRGEGATAECDVYAVNEGGTAMVYITDPANRVRLAPQLKSMFQPLEGVGRVVEPAEYAALGYPDPRTNPQMSDLVLAAKDGYAFRSENSGAPVVDVPPGASPGNHGYLNTDLDMDAIFFAWGRGVRPGTTLEQVRNLDVAPTIAHLLGLTMTGIDGQPIAGVGRTPSSAPDPPVRQ